MSEVFTIQNRPKIITADSKFDIVPEINPTWRIGTFDKLYHFHESWTDEQELALCEWLSLNCTLNFIFVKYEVGILAGGNTDNAEFWTAKKHRRRIKINDYFIKLYETDVTMFEMVWLTNFLGNV